MSMLTPVADNNTPAPIPPEAPSAPEGGPQPGETAQDKLGALISGMLREAQEYNESVIQPAREQGTKYYNGDPLGNEEEGRSRVVSTDVRSAVRNVMPTLLRLFTSSEHYVEFAPRGKNTEALARQRTEYVNYCLNEEPNSAFLLYFFWFKDALARRIGFVKWWWDDSEQIEETDYTGLSQTQLDSLVADSDVKIEDVSTIAGNPAQQIPDTFNCTVTRTLRSGTLRVEPLPGEEVFWDRNARNFTTDFRLVAHSREARVDEIEAMGYEYEEEIRPYIGPSTHQQASVEYQARRAEEGLGQSGQPMAETVQDQHTRPIRFTEAYARMRDPDDPKEKVKLFQVNCVGDTFHVLDYKPISHVPIAYLIADPEPHTVNGLSYADDMKPIQDIRTAAIRGTLDSLAMALTPRIEVNQDMVNLTDLLNTEVGAAIRSRGGVGQVKEFTHHFIGADVAPAFELVDDMTERTIGQSRANLGLDADAMQSSTKAAVAGTFSKGQERTEMLARIFAETGVRHLYKGILRTMVEHQDRKRTVRLRGGEWFDADPGAWNAEMDVVVNVALGAGLIDEKIQILLTIVDKIEGVLMQFGPQNPICGFAEYRQALAKLTELSGYPNIEQFWKPFTQQQEAAVNQQAQQTAAQAPQGPPPDPAAMLSARAALLKEQRAQQTQQQNAALRQQALLLKERAMEMEDSRLRENAAADRVIRLHELALKYHDSTNRAQIDAAIEREKNYLNAHAKVHVAGIQAASPVETAPRPDMGAP